jgi:hypothetical protein
VAPTELAQATVGRVLVGQWLISTSIATLRLHRRCRPGPLVVPGDVAKVVAAQTMPWQPASRYSMRVGETVETSVAELYGDPPALLELL